MYIYMSNKKSLDFYETMCLGSLYKLFQIGLCCCVFFFCGGGCQGIFKKVAFPNILALFRFPFCLS